MTIDGLNASRVLQPASVEELAQLLKEEKGSVSPVGAQTQLHFGNPLRSLDCAIDVTRLNRITEYVPGDLTIHAQAGVTLGELERALEANNQFLPLDPWNGPGATIGGIAATNAQGSLRPTGTIRDWIIGMHVVEVNGNASKTGGRVVKNVTGYDLAKLYTGSIGTLAIITEISLKVRSGYGRTATAVTRLPDFASAANLVSLIRTGPLQPVSCEWIGPENEVWLRFGEHPRAVDWQLKNLPGADWKILEGTEEAEGWASVRSGYQKLGPIVVKVIGLPATIADIVAESRSRAWIAHVMNGIVLSGVSSIEDVRRLRRTHRVIIERASLEDRRQVSTFGLEPAEHELMLRMKRTFDPEGRLNPGRHVDGE